ncbi:hypothetical protein DW115_04430 [Clostridium sp. AM09-51]|nr:hypothetical protein DW115_04430 [Clostridium sp. AM09-51]
MLIDVKNLKEMHVPHVPLLEYDERFYSVPNAVDYAFSTYGRLFCKNNNGGFKKEKLEYFEGEECYNIKFDDKAEKTVVSVKKLIAMVFYPNEKGIYLYNPSWNPFDNKRWKAENFHVLKGKSDIVDAIQSKIEQKEPTYDDYSNEHGFTNQMEFSKSINEKMHTHYWNMKSRATNEGMKASHPQYKDTKVCDDWLNNPDSFYQWFIDNLYFYPGELALDKDILGFGEQNIYSPQYACLVPTYINNAFTCNDSKSGLCYCIREKSRVNGEKYYIVPAAAFCFDEEKSKDYICNSYIEALQAGHSKRANYIRKIVAKERKAGFIPEKILAAMEKWANRCELGLIKIWEPSEEVFKRMGVL